MSGGSESSRKLRAGLHRLWGWSWIAGWSGGRGPYGVVAKVISAGGGSVSGLCSGSGGVVCRSGVRSSGGMLG